MLYIMRDMVRFPLIIIPALAIFAFPLTSLAQSANAVEVFEIGYADAAQIAKAAEMLLSSSGKITADSGANRIIVSDKPANIEKIRELVAKLDHPQKNIVITVEFVEKSKFIEKNIDLKWEARGGGWIVANAPSRQGGQGASVVNLGASYFSGNSTATKKQFLRLLENSTGRIFVGQTVPFTGWLIRNGYAQSETVFKNAGTSFLVTARKTGGGKIMLALVPEVSGYDRESGIISVKNASATLMMDDPGEAVLGGESGSGEAIGASFLRGAGSEETSTEFVMIVRVKSE